MSETKTWLRINRRLIIEQSLFEPAHFHENIAAVAMCFCKTWTQKNSLFQRSKRAITFAPLEFDNTKKVKSISITRMNIQMFGEAARCLVELTPLEGRAREGQKIFIGLDHWTGFWGLDDLAMT
jgi:hypothetical protein